MLDRWAGRDNEAIGKLRRAEIVNMSAAEVEGASAVQGCLLYLRSLDLGINTGETAQQSISVGGENLPLMAAAAELGELDLCGEPAAVQEVMALEAWLSPGQAGAAAGRCRLSLIGTPLGDGAGEIVALLERTGAIRTMLGLKEGAPRLDLRIKGLSFGHANLLGAELRLGRCAGRLVAVSLEANPIFGQWVSGPGDQYAERCGGFLEGLRQSQLTRLNLQYTGIGPTALRGLALALPATLERLDLGHNPLTGLDYRSGAGIRELSGSSESSDEGSDGSSEESNDEGFENGSENRSGEGSNSLSRRDANGKGSEDREDLSGLEALCVGLDGVKELYVVQCGLGPAAAAVLAARVDWAAGVGPDVGPAGRRTLVQIWIGDNDWLDEAAVANLKEAAGPGCEITI
eukprot:SAG11_NODE_130_length_15497_cov_10.780556_9_plen_403_part_00